MNLPGQSCVRPCVHDTMEDIPVVLRKAIEAEVREYYAGEKDLSAFDVAVEVAYGWEPQLVSEDTAWEIPVYVVEIAESIMGKDEG